MPHTVPNSPFFSSIAGNPDLPAVDGIPCTGRNTGECIGLAEDAMPDCAAPVAVAALDRHGFEPVVGRRQTRASARADGRLELSHGQRNLIPPNSATSNPWPTALHARPRRVVAAYATDADECRVFLSMLGIGPAKLEA